MALLSRPLKVHSLAFSRQRGRSVHLSGQASIPSSFRKNAAANRNRTAPLIRPPDPSSLTSGIQEHALRLADWINTVVDDVNIDINQHPKNLLVVTGAGLSTESGIPDYRGHAGSYHAGHKPVLHDQFCSSAAHRRRYWGRSMFGWEEFHQRQPNQGHYALTVLEEAGYLGVTLPDQVHYHADEQDFYFGYNKEDYRRVSILTQNVDRLHHRAGSRYVVELHGRSDQNVCLDCGAHSPRAEHQDELRQRNRNWYQQVLASSSSSSSSQPTTREQRPDGDAELGHTTSYDELNIPTCPVCGTGTVKPDVVFFGDSVPRWRVAWMRDAVTASAGLLVVGTSLAVHSAHRHVAAALDQNKPVAVLNVGPTRVDEREGVITLAAPAGRTLAGAVEHLGLAQPYDA